MQALANPTKRRELVRSIARLASVVPPTMSEALAQYGILHMVWTRLSFAEKSKIRIAAVGEAGLIKRSVCRRTGAMMSLYNAKDQGIESDDDSGLKYAVTCDRHHTVVCVPSIKSGVLSMACPDFCDDCRDDMTAADARRL